MIRSMTGYGRARFEVGDTVFEVDVRSVNHRYLDLRVRVPRPLAALEQQARTRLLRRFDRGKVDVSVQVPAGAGLPSRLALDLDAAGEYVRAARELASRHALPGALDAPSLLALPGVARFAEPELPEGALAEALAAALEGATDAADAMRSQEGKALERELRDRLEAVVELAGQLEARSGAVQSAARERLRKRLDLLREETGAIDEARFYQEVTLAAERLDITEEVVRIRSHAGQLRGILDQAGPGSPVGRRLDFLLQELVREANTIGSKVGDAAGAHLVVELKSELERMREQVQNVE